jgi:arylsulfatase A-like enzyme
LAAEGLVFDDASSPSPWTLPAHASLFTGWYPKRHGMRFYDVRLPQDVTTLAEILSGYGLETVAVVNSHMLTDRYGLDQGFETFEYVNEYPSKAEPSQVESLAIRWLKGSRGRPFFLFLHFYDVHSDYVSLPQYEQMFVRAPSSTIDGTTTQLLELRNSESEVRKADQEHLLDLYDAGIRQLDDGLGRILHVLDERGLLDETLIIVTSDHGEEFFEHGDVLHGRTHFQEVIRIPLIMRGPGVPRGERVGAMVSLLDVAPTVLAALGIPPPEGLDGIDLRRFWRDPGDAAPARLLYTEADHNNTRPDVRRSVRDGRFTLHLDRTADAWALYDLEEDPREQVDVLPRHSETGALLTKELEGFMVDEAIGEAIGPLSEEEKQRLRALGYLE